MDVNVRDYGAVGDDTADDTLAFRAALNAIRATGGTCFVPTGTYRISEYGIMENISDLPNQKPAISSGMHLLGDKLAVLHIHDMAQRTIILCTGEKWSIEGIILQMDPRYENNPTPPPKFIPGAGPITVIKTDDPLRNWTINNCQILDTGHFALVARGTNFTISNNRFKGNNDYPPNLGASPLHEGIIIAISGTVAAPTVIPSGGTIINNTMINVGMNTTGNNHSFVSNRIDNAAYGAGIFMQARAWCHDNKFIGNVCNNGQEGIDDSQNGRFQQNLGMEVWSPHSLFFKNNCSYNCGGGIAVGGRNCVVAFNNTIDNGKDSGHPLHRGSSGLIARNRPASVATGTLWFRNYSTDTRPEGSKTQEYGIEVQPKASAGSLDVTCLSIVNNNFHGNDLGEGLYLKNQPNVSQFKGRDMFYQMCDAKQQDLVWSLLDKDLYDLIDDQYLALNQFLTGSNLERPPTDLPTLTDPPKTS
jgi:hypothetical protein